MKFRFEAGKRVTEIVTNVEQKGSRSMKAMKKCRAFVLMMVLAVVLLVTGAVKENYVHAAAGQTVRVSTAKAIKKAIRGFLK